MSGKLKEVRDRISSIASTQQITSAMKMVSAAKLKKAQDAVVQLRPYALRLNRMLINILSNIEGDVNTTLGTEREVDKALLVVVTSDRGLCGAFNANIIKAAVNTINSDYQEQYRNGKLSIMCIGKKGLEYFKHHYPDVNTIDTYLHAFDDLSHVSVSKIANFLMEQFEAGAYDSVKVAFARFKNAAVQIPEVDQFLPVPKVEVSEEDENKYKSNYIFEPDKNQLLETLIPSIMRTTFHRYLLDNNASEHGARMTAMENATENAKEMMSELKLEFNKARQEAITKELLEIISGASALEEG